MPLTILSCTVKLGEPAPGGLLPLSVALELRGEAGVRVADLADALAKLAADYGAGVPLRVFYQLSVRPLLTVSSRHLIGQVIELCGGRNLSGMSR